ncbi:MAG: hypothetical protein JJT85_06420 [Chromatiales bacterium]|nr:hypothetical protein [Chromatiales bacterium]
MSEKSVKKPLSIAMGAAFLVGGAANVFAASDLPQGYEAGSADRMELIAAGCGKDKDKDSEGSCGEGGCGAV